MTAQNRAPHDRAWPAGRGEIDIHDYITLRAILLNAEAISDDGRWPEALERCQAALAEYRDRKLHRTTGEALAVGLLADDVSRLTGVGRNICDELARGTLLESPLLVVARELAQYRRELGQRRRAST